MSAIRARFAPSPTGVLHLGSARTALANWLFVRGAGGRLLLRFDDTDRERSEAALESSIEDDLRWLGLDWDDGPVRQSERAARYAEALAALPVQRRGDAYEFQGRVIARADGSALYNLACAVDDIDDAVSHVIRGRDHTANTELQSALIRALGTEPPQYVHLPLLVFEGGAKLSKREGDALTVGALRKDGVPAPALCNALALSLADFGTEEVMLSTAEMASRFDLARLHTADSQFDADKLAWVSGEHIRAMSLEFLAGELAEFGSGPLPAAAVEAARTGGTDFVSCAAVGRVLVDPPVADDEAVWAMKGDGVEVAASVLDGLVVQWPPDVATAETAFAALKSELRSRDVKLGPALHGLRAALTGRVQGPEFPLVLACVDEQRWRQARAALEG